MGARARGLAKTCGTSYVACVASRLWPPGPVSVEIEAGRRYHRFDVRQAIPFGKYLLLDRISVGGMAEVFKAKSYGVEGFEKVIAIKRILPSMGEDREFIKMFIDEAKIVGQLAHTNICQIFELGRTDGAHFIAMEYIWGKDLLQIQNRLRKLKQQMQVAMACFLVAKVCEGLDYAHKKRDALGRPLEIVHRDCSPQNILVSYEGEVKLIDFGIAKAASRSSRTQAGVLKGKFGYMSPEQVRGLPLDRRSDIFSVGTILYECLSGDRLFVGETDFSTLEKVRNVDIPRPRAINPNIPEEVERIIMKALARDAEDRYQWCSEMVADLQRWLMSQENVFTAKSLATWLKEGFANELERERQQLEAFKKVGREGLIAGVPQAEAKLDVVEHLGEAGQAEDPTVLGGPSFEDIIADAGGAGPAPGAPSRRPTSDPGAEFEGEGPTEIFGEISEAGPPPQPPPSAPTVEVSPSARRPQTHNHPRAATPAPVLRTTAAQPAFPPPAPPQPPARGMPLMGAPAAPPPSSLSRPEDPTISPLGMPGFVIPHDIQQANAQHLQAQGQGAGHGSQAKTLLGMAAPVLPLQAPPQTGQMASAGPPPAGPAGAFSGMTPGSLSNPGIPLPSFPPPDHVALGSQPPHQGGQMPIGAGVPSFGPPGQTSPPPYGAPPPGYPGPPPGYPGGLGAPMPPQGYGGYPPPGHPMSPSGGYPQAPSGGYPQAPSGGYPQAPYPYPQAMPGYGPPTGAQQVDLTQKRRKKPSLAKDIGIGIGIAAVVLGVFAVVKFVVLADDGAKTAVAAAAATKATLEVKLADGGAADVFLNGERRGAAANGVLAVADLAPGVYDLTVARDGTRGCAGKVELVAGKVEAFACTLELAAPPPVEIDAAVAVVAEAADAGAEVAAVVDAGVAEVAVVIDAGAVAIVAADAAAAAEAPAAAKTTDKPAADKAADKPAADKPRTAADKTRTSDRPRIDLDSELPPAKPADKTAAKTTADKAAAKTTTAKATAAKAEDVGYLTAYATPFAQVSIDGKPTGKSTPITPMAKIPLSPGVHKVTFTVGREKFTYAIEIEAGKTAKISKDLPVTADAP